MILTTQRGMKKDALSLDYSDRETWRLLRYRVATQRKRDINKRCIVVWLLRDIETRRAMIRGLKETSRHGSRQAHPGVAMRRLGPIHSHQHQGHWETAQTSCTMGPQQTPTNTTCRGHAGDTWLAHSAVKTKKDQTDDPLQVPPWTCQAQHKVPADVKPPKRKPPSLTQQGLQPIVKPHLLRQVSFFPRTIADWNGLPEETVSAPTLDSFESRLQLSHWSGKTSFPEPPSPIPCPPCIIVWLLRDRETWRKMNYRLKINYALSFE